MPTAYAARRGPPVQTPSEVLFWPLHRHGNAVDLDQLQRVRTCTCTPEHGHRVAVASRLVVQPMRRQQDGHKVLVAVAVPLPANMEPLKAMLCLVSISCLTTMG